MTATRLDSWLDTASGAAQRWPRLVLVLLCLALHLPGFFTIPATDRDESRFAQATRQMVETGDYVQIRVGEEERNKKPIGIHWAQAASVHMAELTGLGDRRGIWAYRIPSLLGAILAVLATFQFGRGLVGRRTAMLAAAMLAGCMVLMVEAHIAKTDAALLATITAAMGLFGSAYLRPDHFTALKAAAFWVILGIGVLLKGPIAPMVPLLTGLTLAFCDRRAGGGWLHAPWLRPLRLPWGIPLMLLLVLPWMTAIGIATEGRFFSQAIGGDMLGKVGSGDEKHWGPPGYYLLTFLISAFPAGFVVVLALRQSWAERRKPATRFLLAWIVPTWLVFEAVATKLPHYTLPAFPALMLLGAAWAMDPLRREPPRWLRWAAKLAVAGVALGLALVAVALTWAVTGHEPLGALLALPAAALLIWLAWREMSRASWARSAALAVVAAIPVYVSVMELTFPRIEALWIAPRIEALLAERTPGLPSQKFGITGHAEPSTLFHVGGGLQLLRRGEDAAIFLAADAGRVVAVGDRAEADFRREAARLGLRLEEMGSVDGLNYTRGRRVTLRFYRVAAP
ncbi:glycosyltransferase family 39 protein [Roseococcus sp. SYP-B2431]|uniref:ArnT family glycosyltransferase n=1 Tax=Roseococcus sp. SYP-B2431 TaxID=2496640 RepID=UPI001038961B|nr:glycosyltransferase family 39 protein [Roseococcus sp. SYP-B2431]TCH98944.1 glycosyltransferase family 39 protein [Roseococcus sp. SYP-B2431]